MSRRKYTVQERRDIFLQSKAMVDQGYAQRVISKELGYGQSTICEALTQKRDWVISTCRLCKKLLKQYVSICDTHRYHVCAECAAQRHANAQELERRIGLVA